MQLAKLTVVVLLWCCVVTVRICRSEVDIATSKSDKSTSRLANDVVNIVTSCYKGRINGILLAGDLPGSLYKTLSVQQLIPVALVDDIMKYNDDSNTVPLQFQHKLQVFIIEAASSQGLETLISMNIQYSTWSNRMGSFFILLRKCINVEDFLYIAWKWNILDAKVMCWNHESERIIFTYNPFTSQAPAPWRKVKVVQVPPGHPFTMFSLEYRANETICASISFDKVKDLGGYPICVSGLPVARLLRFDIVTERGNYQHWSLLDNFFRNIFNTLNARAKYNRLHKCNQPVDMFYDPTLTELSLSAPFNILTTYPRHQDGSVIVTQFRRYKPKSNKLISVHDVDSRYVIVIIYFVSLVFIKIFFHQALVPALLNLIRITCNMPFANVPINASSRAYLTSLLFFVVTMQGIFKGNLVSLLTQNIPLKNVDTQQNLVDFDIKKIYGTFPVKSMISHPDLKNRFVSVNSGIDCFMAVINDSSAACITWGPPQALTWGKGFDLARKYNLHLSTKHLDVVYASFSIRRDWPLEHRVNAIIARIVEASVIQTWDFTANPIKLNDFQMDREVNTDKVIKVIGLYELRFAFVILSVGLVCATAAFIIEVATQYKYRFRFKRRDIRSSLVVEI